MRNALTSVVVFVVVAELFDANGSCDGVFVQAATTRTGAKDCSGQISSTRQQKSGTIVSPNYGGYYPPDSVCRYRFHGNDQERIQVTFTHIDLNYPHGDPSDPTDCSQVDFVEVRLQSWQSPPASNGRESTQSTTGSERQERDQVLGVYCGSKLPPTLMSSDSRLTITFVSRSDSSGVGFRALYQFVTDFGIKGGEQDENYGCSFVYKSSRSLNGTFSSPNYPGLYPRNTECTYLLVGRPGQRIVVFFQHFDVDGIPPACSETAQSDFVEIFQSADQPPTRYCASMNSHQRKITSQPGATELRIKFKSNNVYDATGFEAIYEFQTTTKGGSQGASSRASRDRSTVDRYIRVIYWTVSLTSLSTAFACCRRQGRR